MDIDRVIRIAKKLTAGGCSFYAYGNGSNAGQVFKALREEAQYQRGHGGYSGTIAEKDDFKIVAKPMTREEAETKANTQISDNDKWGPAYAIPIIEGKSTQIKGYLFFGIASC